MLVGVIVAALWFAMQLLVDKKERDLAAFAMQARPITTIEAATVIIEPWQRYLYSVGSFNAIQDVNVTNETEGKVTSIKFESGQKIDAGKVLITLDTSVDTAELDALLADQRLTELQFERSKRLVAENTISKSEFDIAAAKRDGATATARAKAAGVRKKIIRAPFSGILGIRKIDLGEYLEAGSEIVSLQMLQPIYLDFAVPERFISLVTLGQTIDAEVQAYPGQVFRGTVTAVNPSVERNTRNFLIRASVENSDRRLRPGMFAEVRGTVPTLETMLTIPEIAVAYAPYGNSVFVIEKNGGDFTVSRQQIQTGEIRAGRVAVLSGLGVGDQIVSAGHNKLRNGMKVQIDKIDQIPSVVGGK